MLLPMQKTYRFICRIKKEDYIMLIIILCIVIVVGVACLTWAKDAKDGVNQGN